MTIHVNIGKAKANLSKLISASLRGEEVVIDNDGKPQVRLIPVVEAQADDREARRRKIDEILARADALPRLDKDFDLEWDENGLPICQSRSEEHPSELQSLMRISYVVFCLKKTIHTHTYT